jgi:hypothetical protein
MADPIKWRSTILLAKIETTYGTDPTPTGAANAILAQNVELRPMEGEDVSRDLEYPWLGAQPEIPVGLRAVVTFTTELQGSGAAGTAPAWGPLMRACACSEVIVASTSVTYAPVSDAMESVTVWLWKGATKHIVKGCRGTARIEVDAQGIPKVRWTLTGLWAEPAEVSRVTPTLTGWQKPLVATKTNTPTFTVNAVALVLRSFAMDIGNDVQPRLLIGKEEIIIVDRSAEIAARVEAVPLTTLNPFALANAQTSVACVLVHGTAAGKIVTVNAPTCQVKRLSGYENQQDVLEWPLALKAIPNAGNDEFSVVLT